MIVRCPKTDCDEYRTCPHAKKHWFNSLIDEAGSNCLTTYDVHGKVSCPQCLEIVRRFIEFIEEKEMRL